MGASANGVYRNSSRRARFVALFNDLGAGAVSTYARGKGAATFTRATVAWTKLASGLWAEVASGTARSCYLGATTAVGAYGGYFAEGAATQLVTPTASIRDMTDASWVKVTMTAAKNATGIDGVASSATTLTATGASSTILQTLVAAASSRTYSCFMRRKTGTGTILIAQGATTEDVTSQLNSTTYTRVDLTASILNAAIGIQINTSGDEVEVDFNQFEADAIATSPMASAGAARNADVLSYPSTGNYSNTAGTAYVEVTFSGGSGKPRIITDSSTGDGPLLSNATASMKTEMFDGATEIIVANTGALGITHKAAASWGGVVGSVILNGGTIVSGVYDGSMITNNINICSYSGSQYYGFSRNAHIWLRTLPDAVSQVMTT